MQTLSEQTLSDLASAMCAAIPPGEMSDYVQEVDAWHIINTRAPLPKTPENAPYYGQAFADALAALKMGHTARIAYHIDRIAAAVRRSGKGGVLQEQKRIFRVYGTVSHPTDRKTFEGGRVPRTGKY